MRLRERTDDDRLRGGPNPDDASDANLRALRLAGQNLLAAGSNAIRKALSSNSEQFLAATRQQGSTKLCR